MPENQSLSDKQYMAKILYTREQLNQKTVAEKVGVSTNTMSEWVRKFNWDDLRNRLLVGKEEVLNNLYVQLEELNNRIRKKPAGQRYGDTKEADILIKYTASIRNLETELAIADLVEGGIRFVKHLQKVGTHDQVLLFSDLWNGFIQTELRK